MNLMNKAYTELTGDKRALTVFFYFADNKGHRLDKFYNAWGNPNKLLEEKLNKLIKLGVVYSTGKTARLTGLGRDMLEIVNSIGMI